MTRLIQNFRLSLWAVLLLPWSICIADTLSGNININIVNTISIVELQQVNFGVLLNQAGVCNMNGNGDTSGTIISCTGNETEGLFNITGTTGSTIALTVSPGSANDITFAPSLPNGNTLVLSGSGPASSAQVVVAGSLTVGNAANNGITQIPYTLIADYN